ncbi:anti-sigma factor family protein, partial [Burkholderia sp. Ac-20379]|uniref:anti-sigma factor family protein n=1 Tax=Burkholderia sp. Ac-20379 TaxID=2703900 RepID=UPI001DAB5A16|nr:anti-sigma factor [Burkholderia sp. Ac-20379]
VGRDMANGTDGGGGSGGSILHASYGGEALARQSAIAYVTYAPMVTRPVEVGADREQELVQWLSSRLGTDVRPPILTRAGYELMGGRLLPGDDGPIAQFMYHNALGERITLNISHRKLASDVTAFKLYQSGPVNVFYWVDGRFGYAVSGGMDRHALLDLSHEVYEQLTASGGPQPAK